MKKDDPADFINCIAFGKTGETIAQYITKGRQLAISGRIQTGKFEKDGVTRYTTDVVVDGFDFIGEGGKGTQNNSPSNQFPDIPNDDDGMMPMDDGDIPF